MYWFLIISYNRPEMLLKCVDSIISNCNAKIGVALIGTSVKVSELLKEKGVLVSCVNKGYPAEKRKEIYEKLEHLIDDEDFLIFCDDDVEYNETLRKIDQVSEFYDKNCDCGCIQFMANRLGSYAFKKIDIGFSGGGIFVRKSVYESFGGHGKDYLDDVELFLRSYLAGYENYRCGFIYAKHKIGSRGGLSDLVGRRGRENHLSRSRLDAVYKGMVERCSNWLGFKITKQGRLTHRVAKQSIGGDVRWR